MGYPEMEGTVCMEEEEGYVEVTEGQVTEAHREAWEDSGPWSALSRRDRAESQSVNMC